MENMTLLIFPFQMLRELMINNFVVPTNCLNKDLRNQTNRNINFRKRSHVVLSAVPASDLCSSRSNTCFSKMLSVN